MSSHWIVAIVRVLEYLVSDVDTDDPGAARPLGNHTGAPAGACGEIEDAFSPA